MCMLLLLSRFSRVQLCVTQWTAAHQAPPSLGCSRQEHWSGLPFPSPVHESEKWKWSRLVISDSSRPHGCSLPVSSVHGIFQARVLEWGAIAFSVCVCSWRYISITYASLRLLHITLIGILSITLNSFKNQLVDVGSWVGSYLRDRF